MVRLSIKKTNAGDWKVRWYEEGKYVERKAYYASDKEDAEQTMEATYDLCVAWGMDVEIVTYPGPVVVKRHTRRDREVVSSKQETLSALTEVLEMCGLGDSHNDFVPDAVEVVKLLVEEKWVEASTQAHKLLLLVMKWAEEYEDGGK